MKRLPAILLLCLLFSTAFVAQKGDGDTSRWPDSLRSLYLYTEGIKQRLIAGDSLRARELYREAIRNDSTFAPAWYELAASGMYDSREEMVELARTAHELDTANKWYHQFYGQALIMAGRYDEALGVYRRLRVENPRDPDVYRLLAALYEQNDEPYMALATLDSAEIRFGRIPLLSQMKRRLLIVTHQTDKAIAEARATVEAAPYEAQNHVALAELYGMTGKDSLALAQYDEAMRIDSTAVETLTSLADYHTARRDFQRLLGVTRRLFELDEMPLEMKIRRFEQYTSDRRFYREYYPQLNELASILAVRYPHDRRVVKLYADHLIASGELEQALALYKLHLEDQPPAEEFFGTVIDIESYLQRPDSVDRYVDRALELFPGEVSFHIAKGNIHNYARRYDKAVATYKSALRYADTDSLRSAIWTLIGDTWHARAEQRGTAADPTHKTQPKTAQLRKYRDQCYKAYEKSLRYDPDNTLTLNNFAYFLAVEGRDLERALAMATRVVELTDNNPTYLDTHAWVLFRMGRTAEAKKILQQAIALDGQQSRELLVHYGDILSALGERFMAEIYWRKALEKGYDARQIEERMEKNKAPKP